MTVTASYDAVGAAPGELSRLVAWARAGDGRTLSVDHSIPPVRWTMSVDFLLRAPTAGEAEGLAVRQFLAESTAADISPPETVLGATGPPIQSDTQ